MPDQNAAPSPFVSPVEYPPQRVVSLVPSLTESLFDLDLGDRVIAITDYCVHPADKVQLLPRVGGPDNPDIGRIVALQPDLVLLNDEDNRPEDADALRAAGIPIWVTGPRTVFDALNVLWNIMDLFDHPAMVPRVREIERAYDYTVAASRAIPPVRVCVPIWRDPWMTFNAETYAHDVVRVCGGQNVFAGRAASDDEPVLDDGPRLVGHRYPRISLDEVIEAQPDVVLLPSEPYAFSEADARLFRQLNIPAARAGRILLIDGTLLTWHGTRVAYALRDLPPLLMGEQDDDRAGDPS
jgi:ABC-type Fe3+-hydroxamate transport system substrate-binding protein